MTGKPEGETMSDRVSVKFGDNATVSVELADLLAAVAEIDGAEVVSLDGANVGDGVPDGEIELSIYMEREKGVEWFRRNVRVLVVPLPDEKETER